MPKPYGILNSFHCFKDGDVLHEVQGIIVQRAVHKLNSGWISAKTEDMGGISAGQERAILLAVGLAEFRMNPRHCWEIALADGFTFEQVGILGIPHNF